MGQFIIGCLDGYGYLRLSIAEIADQLRQSRAKVLRIVKAIQQLEPKGVGARSLEECLLIQAESLGCLTPEIRQVILYYLPDLAEGRLGRIAQELNLSLLQVQAIRDFIRTLDPKPGRQYSDGDQVHYIAPDITVAEGRRRICDPGERAVGNRLHVSNHYRRILTSPEDVDGQTKRYVETKLNSAVWLIRSIEQRRLTIYQL